MILLKITIKINNIIVYNLYKLYRKLSLHKKYLISYIIIKKQKKKKNI